MRSVRWLLAILITIVGLSPIQLGAQPLAQGKNKFLGAGTSSPVGRFFSYYWNQVTPGNAGKWGSVSFTRGQYNWSNLDTIYNYAVQHGILYKHHTLVWGSQQPGWIDGLDSASQRAEVENWIKLVGQRYPKMDFVDVVNEPLHAPPSYKNALGGDGVTGWDWVITAFQWARQYCAPGVKLILNEYNVLGSADNATSFLTIINLLKDRNLIDGIGVQGHYFEFRSHIGATSGTYIYSPATLKDNLNRLTATGLPVYITEFDIDEPVDSDQLAQYKIYFPVFWTNPGVKGITFWGYIQDDVWSSFPYTYLLDVTGRGRPALDWLRTYINTPIPPTLVSPIAVSGTPRNPVLVWNSSPLATSYHVEVSASRTFAGFAVDTTVTDTLFQPMPLASNVTYYWRVSGVNLIGASDFSGQVAFTTADFVSGIETADRLPGHFGLSQNYPNPFNPSTAISYQLPAPSGAEGTAVNHVTLGVFDVLGRQIAVLVDGVRTIGVHTVTWDASAVPSGVYFYRMQAGGHVVTKKMIVSK